MLKTTAHFSVYAVIYMLLQENNLNNIINPYIRFEKRWWLFEEGQRIKLPFYTAMIPLSFNEDKD